MTVEELKGCAWLAEHGLGSHRAVIAKHSPTFRCLSSTERWNVAV